MSHLHVDVDRGLRGPGSITWRALLLLLLVVILDTGAWVLLKWGAPEWANVKWTVAHPTPGAMRLLVSQPQLWVGAGLLLASFFVWSRALTMVDLSAAVPIQNLYLATVPVTAWLVLGEEINAQRWCGVALICVGVVINASARCGAREVEGNAGSGGGGERT